jgi:hypothetical protein
MNKYIVSWDAGFGESFEEISATTEEAAQDIARMLCMEEVESNITYKVVGIATDRLRWELL